MSETSRGIDLMEVRVEEAPAPEDRAEIEALLNRINAENEAYMRKLAADHEAHIREFVDSLK